MTPHPSPKPIALSSRICIALVASTPFVLFQLVFLSDLNGWTASLFGYMGIVVVAPIIFAGWCVFCLIEYGVRRSTGERRVPFFAIAGGMLLVAFFLPALIVHKIALKIPSLCRVHQSIEWPTSRPHPAWNTKHSFVLVLNGGGTKDNHRFTSGYLNWTGNESAGFTSIHFAPLTLQEQYFAQRKSGTYDHLKSRMAQSAISDDELEAISQDVWQVITRTNEGLELLPRTGITADTYSDVDDHWDYIIGGWIWIFLLISLFMLIGQRTLGVSRLS